MRVTSEFFVSALLRRVFQRGDYAAVLHKGMDAAGAIHIRCRHRQGTETLYGPAPQSLVEEDGEGAGRSFEERLSAVAPEAVDAALTRELRFDPDAWVVELECDDVAGLFSIIGVTPPENPADSLFRR
ncbi:hypothetical protein SAMN05880582_10784 [Rhizobium sp. RU20A]|uniref:DUF1491 family protein n=1 Tax=Rhizobium sp. RU20A TaxID=1907412 RepID=UPI00095493FC|nr:DUF1491 family protein [Rhizobium sp. RU20A]SIR16403.1 hypothetical protein SAMN05880582_10784 [Rhizobium sp. RU20A]